MKFSLRTTHLRFSWLIPLILICVFQNICAQEINNYERLKKEFKKPPLKSWPKTYWWWINGNIDTVRIREEIISMKNAGLSGFDIFEIGAKKIDSIIPTGEITFMGDDFLRAMKVALDQASSLDMEVGLNMASSWNAGGSWVTPENSAKSIYFSKTAYSKGQLKLPFPKLVRVLKEGQITFPDDDKSMYIDYSKDGKPVFYKEIAIIAVPSKSDVKVSEIIDVSQYFDSKTETLNWDSEGDYNIYRYVCSNSGEQLKVPSKNSVGPIIDHFDARATTAHFNYIIDRLKIAFGLDLSKTALKSFYLASYEARGNVWTESVLKEFKRLNGYEINRFLPALFNKTLFSEEVTAKFMKDYQFTLSELMIDNFYRKAKEICNANGILINSEAGGPGFPLHNVPVEPLKSLGIMDLPRGEFWINHSRFDEHGININRVVKEASAASHIYGKGIVELEAFTTFQHWQEGPFDMKPYGDQAFCEGMNKVVIHGSSHNPSGIGSPGISYHAGTHYNDKRVWWPMIKPFNTYLSRISYILQNTDFVADVLYYYGDAVPNFTGHKNSRFMVGSGYDYEVINTEILKKLSIRNNQLVLPTGRQFKLLYLEDEGEIDPEVFLKLKELTAKGAKIVSEKPEKIIARENRPDLKVSLNDINKLWLDVGGSVKDITKINGKVFSGISSLDLLKKIGVSPDLYYEDNEFSTLDYIHYKKGTTDYYFVRNTTNEWVSRQCSFRQTNKTPEIWDPVTGDINKVNIYEQLNEQVNMPITLPPYGAFFVVFSEGVKPATYSKINSDELNPPLLQYTTNGTFFLEEAKIDLLKNTETKQVSNYIKTRELEGAWEVYFTEEQKKSGDSVIFPELVSWTKSENDSIKYFSGIAKYVKTFQYDINSSTAKNQKVYLDLGELSNVGEVWLNGVSLGVTWTKPYRFEVTNALKYGYNLLEVKVANTWSNRLKGDAVKGENFTYTNILETVVPGLNKKRVLWKDVPLKDSGLMGPVKLMFMKPIE
ncbi:alpha-L-rhamnosidase [Flaviramulus basaltis]|uniref:Alpha-L-rhamnosidase n=1 Tax=Flaviramulus basaltis TaxID=369401 RepID=A0A1K2IMA8_9FLAO|nr:glycosyl hydrolase [Flaviramulus basaltis]SFZ93588.1 alpha-L-rhamnosidase [Flaviramulus basaltis]